MERGRPDGCAICGQVPSATARFCRRCGARLRTQPVDRDAAETEPKAEHKE